MSARPTTAHRTWNSFFGVAFLLLATGSIAWCGTRTSTAQDQQEQVEDVMKAKLRHAQNLLKAVALDDFDAIIKDSQALSLLSQEASWNMIQTPEYLQHSIDFRRAVDSMNKAGKEKNLDAVTLAYFQMTMRCVDCHRHVRTIRVGETPALELDAPLLRNLP